MLDVYSVGTMTKIYFGNVCLQAQPDCDENRHLSACAFCNGTGEVELSNLKCIMCKGEKVVEGQKVLTIDINKGMV